MTEEGWFRFLTLGEPPIVSVGRLPEFLCARIGASNTLIRMKHEYALKSAHKHRLRPIHFPMLPVVIDCGFAVSDRAQHLTFYFYENVVFGGWMAATVKATNSGHELWVSTFHVASDKKAKRMRKKFAVLRPEKL